MKNDFSLAGEIEKVVSERFKPVEYIKLEDNWGKDSVYDSEYTKVSYAPIMGKEDSYYETKRSAVSCFIKFKDNTGCRLELQPQDYLSELRENTYKRDEGFGCKSLVTSHHRDFDYDKILKTILNTLKEGKRYENPSLRILDLASN